MITTCDICAQPIDLDVDDCHIDDAEIAHLDCYLADVDAEAERWFVPGGVSAMMPQEAYAPDDLKRCG